MTETSPLVIHEIQKITVVNFNTAAVLDAIHIQSIADQLYDLVDKRACRKLILDLTKVRYFSSQALGVLISLYKKSQAIKGSVVLCGVNDELMKLFKLTNLHKFFRISADEKEALASFSIA